MYCFFRVFFGTLLPDPRREIVKCLVLSAKNWTPQKALLALSFGRAVHSLVGHSDVLVLLLLFLWLLLFLFLPWVCCLLFLLLLFFFFFFFVFFLFLLVCVVLVIIPPKSHLPCNFRGFYPFLCQNPCLQNPFSVDPLLSPCSS